MPSLTVLTNGAPANPDLWGEEQQRLVRASVCNTFAKLVVLVATKGRGQFAVEGWCCHKPLSYFQISTHSEVYPVCKDSLFAQAVSPVVR